MTHSKHGRPRVLAEIQFEKNASSLRGKPLREVFSFIHESNLWGAKSSRSGLGSELDSTLVLRSELPLLLRKFGVRSILDLPCGDFGWMNQVTLPVENYIGADIVEELVDSLKKLFGGRRNGTSYTFRTLDLTNSELPEADLVLCRDCLVHLSFANVRLALDNLRRSGSRYLLTTSFPRVNRNIDISDGDWRPLNLEAAPFYFPKSLLYLNENCTEAGGAYADKSLGLWEISSLPDSF